MGRLPSAIAAEHAQIYPPASAAAATLTKGATAGAAKLRAEGQSGFAFGDAIASAGGGRSAEKRIADLASIILDRPLGHS